MTGNTVNKSNWNGLGFTGGVTTMWTELDAPGFGFICVRRKGGDCNDGAKLLTGAFKNQDGKWYSSYAPDSRLPNQLTTASYGL